MLKELEKMYDYIFEDSILQKLFLNFHSKNWYQITLDDKKKIIRDINERVATIYGYTPDTIKEVKSGNYGTHSAYKQEISINPESLENDSGYEIIDTYFHELRHSFQSRAVENQLTDKEYISEDLKLELEKNMLPGNYTIEGKYYRYQVMERDAWSHGMLFARKVYILNKKVIKDNDEEWKKYCSKYKDTIIHFISDNDEAREEIEKMKNELEEQYDSKIEDKQEYALGKKLASELTKKNFKDMDFKDVATLMSPYAFSNLDITQKVALLNRYRDLVKYRGLSYSIKENTVGSIKMKNKVFPIDSSITLINDLLSENFKKMVNDIVNGVNEYYPLTNRAKVELSLNMYRNKEGKLINFVKDTDNLFVFSLQPYARYESDYVLREFKKLKDVELEVFNKQHAIWDYWDNFYDNEIIYKTASEVMGIPFKEYYLSQLDKYKENIMNDLYPSKATIRK